MVLWFNIIQYSGCEFSKNHDLYRFKMKFTDVHVQIEIKASCLN